jgi:hypothetical protein
MQRLLPLVALLVMLMLAASAGAAAKPAADACGMHSMVYSNAPYSFKRAMFKQAAAIGVRHIRADLALTQVITTSSGGRDWRPVDQYMALARRYRLRVTLVLLATPWWEAACPSPAAFAESYKCPPRDPGRWAAWAGEIARRTRGVIERFEIVNEPDNPHSFFGTPQQYAQLLVASYAAIKAANPRAQVLLGGIYRPAAHGWIGAVFASPGAADSFDIANVHIRGTLQSVSRQVVEWKAFFGSCGFPGPLWVTEHGYPSATRRQVDPAFRGGRRAQARYLRASVVTILRAGAALVFVTQRDNLGGWFASEGVLGGAVEDPPSANPRVIRKPAFYALRALIKAAS